MHNVNIFKPEFYSDTTKQCNYKKKVTFTPTWYRVVLFKLLEQGFHKVTFFTISFPIQKFSLQNSKIIEHHLKKFLLQMLQKTVRNIFV